MDYYLQLTINGLVTGSIYAVVALGFALIYGVLRIVNFAHGVTCVAGGYVGYVIVSLMQWPLWSAFIAAALAGALIGWLVERVAFRPFRGKSTMLPMVSSLACAIIVENALAAVFGHTAKSFRADLGIDGRHEFWGASITNTQLMILAVSISFMCLLYLYISNTNLGRQTLAVSDDIDASATWGIDANRVIRLNCMIASALASVAGLLIAIDIDIDPYMGTDLAFKAFTANLLFGIGSLPGSLLGGQSLGLLESLVSGLVSTRYKSAYTFIVLIGVLLARPYGILDTRTRRFEK